MDILEGILLVVRNNWIYWLLAILIIVFLPSLIALIMIMVGIHVSIALFFLALIIPKTLLDRIPLPGFLESPDYRERVHNFGETCFELIIALQQDWLPRLLFGENVASLIIKIANKYNSKIIRRYADTINAFMAGVKGV